MGRIINILYLRKTEQLGPYDRIEDVYVFPHDTEQVILLHGTSSRFLDDILAKENGGIKPQRLTGNNCWSNSTQVASNPDFSYFGDFEKARYFAMNCCSKYSGSIVYVQVVIPVELLIADDEIERRFEARDWRESLAHGSCASREIITDIVNVCTPGNGRFYVRAPELTFLPEGYIA